MNLLSHLRASFKDHQLSLTEDENASQADVSVSVSAAALGGGRALAGSGRFRWLVPSESQHPSGFLLPEEAELFPCQEG